MTLYFVDRSKIDETLQYIDAILQEMVEQEYDTFMQKLSLERAIHILIESILDVGNMMIDGFIMRDPGSYEDIIDIMIDENVLPKQDEKAYKDLIQLRSMLVNDYLNIDHASLKLTVDHHQEKLRKFSTYIQSYLDNELGVANAFSNE